ncbi:hypothetical protein KR222_004696 [Zaprionus bogoriensis]|nr:hypothetical protein KR222_004696 [Zaprionus bogoriensis]
MKFFVIAFAVIAAAAATTISTEYLPPVDNNLEVVAESIEAPVEQGVLSDDGYRYKTVRRLKLRHRRDVSELSPEYLPPVQEASQAIPVEVSALESAPLADDGYRYKTVRRLKLRHRRDVSELSPEYLPPVQEASQAIPVEVPALESAPLADDGYRYKTVRRLKLRHRRDVNELSPEYLPPVPEASQDIAIAVPAEESAVLADDGYRYKTVRRVIRRRRDVSELSPEYLPPVEEASEAIAVETPLADDGYRYKTVRRLKLRHRRDVNELSPEYLPPVGEASQDIAVEVPAVETAALADDGYRYKTVRRLKLRHRRDVNELSPEYLPPVPEASQEIAIEVPAVESAALADDGYRYKTVRRVIRRRRDVSELSSEYLPPVEQVAAGSAIIDVPAEPTVLAEDGYRYKTVRRLKLRRH